MLLKAIQRKTNLLKIISFYKMKLLAGRNMLPSDSLSELIINETFVRRMGITNPEKAIGQQITWPDGKKFPVVGVLADFH